MRYGSATMCHVYTIYLDGPVILSLLHVLLACYLSHRLQAYGSSQTRVGGSCTISIKHLVVCIEPLFLRHGLFRCNHLEERDFVGLGMPV